MIFSALVDGLARRRAAGLPPFTVLSCDNLPDSGAAARSATLALAESRDADLAGWIAAHVTFPASMVDRITPATTADDVASIEEEFAVRDRSPVITEAFAQWVIEDSFCNARPPLDTVGVRFVEDVAPYKRIKSRVLNGGHCALGYLGYLAGYRRSDEAMADPAIAEFLEALIAEELAPLLPSDVPGMELTEYRQAVLKRFANPAISDQLSRLCRRGSTKMADYLLPSLIEATRFGRPRGLLTLVLAAWLRYLRGTDLAGEAIDVNDPRADELVGLANRNGGDPTAVLRLADLFGPLAEDAAMAGEVRDRVRALDRDGVQATVRAVLSASSGGARVA
jgi:mannitol-1-phosphate/altronate dehydrogenase